MYIECSLCDSTGWVCEDHSYLPWGGASSRRDACNCGGAGAPCPACNPSDREHKPRLPEGYRSLLKTEDFIPPRPPPSPHRFSALPATRPRNGRLDLILT